MSEPTTAVLVLDWVRVLAPLALSLVLLLRQRRQGRAVAKNGKEIAKNGKDIALRPDNQKVLDIVELGITSVEKRLLERIGAQDARIADCEQHRTRLAEQNDRLVEQNTRLVERIERLLTKRGEP